MDAATRAELDVLRRRAYGPSPDIAGDEAAIARLIALEELALPTARVLPTPAASAEVPASLSSPSGSIDAGATRARVIETSPRSGRSALPRWHLGLVIAVALIALPLGMIAATPTGTGAGTPSAGAPTAAAGAIAAKVREARVFAADPESEILMRVRIDGYFGTHVDVPVGADVPLFPVEGLMTWAEPLGDYYGWRLWIGGARGGVEDENCMLLDGDGTVRADCVSTSLRADGALLLTVPYDEMAPDDRPETMTADQSLGFWWDTDGAITLLLSPTPDPGSGTLVPILIDEATGDFVDASSSAGTPQFPVPRTMSWAQPLGVHYGWSLWVGAARGSRGDQNCLLLDRAGGTRSRCLTGEWEAEGPLRVSLSYAQIAADQRPSGMTADQSIVFSWEAHGYVTIRLTGDPGS